MSESLPAVTIHLLDLFQGPLRDVRFPDADADRLAAAIDAAATARESVAIAEVAVDAARLELHEKLRLVSQETERTLAYVRVYASDRPDVKAALDAAPTAKATARRSPGRPRKVLAAAGEAAEAAE